MAIDLQSETVVSLAEAAKTLPQIDGRRIHVSTLWRWARRGVRGVQLEYVRLGHRVCTSVPDSSVQGTISKLPSMAESVTRAIILEYISRLGASMSINEINTDLDRQIISHLGT